MNFELTPEQDMLFDSAQKFVARRYSFENRRLWAESEQGFDADNWQTFADLGWLALPISEDDGGIGGNSVDVMLLQQVFGTALVTEPYVPNVILCGGLIERLGDADQKERYLTPMMSGDAQFGFAHTEQDAGNSLTYVGTRATAKGSDVVLSGRKIMVLNGHAADTFVVTARTGGDLRDSAGIGLFLVKADAPGLTVTEVRTIDGLRAANVEFDGVVVPPRMQMGTDRDDALQTVNDRAILAAGAEAVGMMKTLFEVTLAYVKERKQFNVPIGSFQVLQHRIVDMLIAYEDCKSALLMASFAAQGGGAEAQRAASGLKVKLAESGVKLAEQAIQLHGAIGTTDELNVGYYYKRLLMFSHLFGSTGHHLDRFGRLAQ